MHLEREEQNKQSKHKEGSNKAKSISHWNKIQQSNREKSVKQKLVLWKINKIDKFLSRLKEKEEKT